MGRIRTTLVKRTGQTFVDKFPDKFKVDFTHNKLALNEVGIIYSKKLRNLIAGYITHLLKESKN